MSPNCKKCDCGTAGMEVVEVKKGERYCKPCYDQTFFICQRCEPQFKRPKERVPNLKVLATGEEVCEYCYYTKFSKCHSCQAEKLRNEGIVLSSGRFYCQSCARDRHFNCQYCNQNREIDQLWRRIEGYGPVCVGCQHSYQEEFDPPAIQPYNFKPKPKFQNLPGKTPTNKLYFGVELEVDHYKSTGPGRGDIPESVHQKNEKNAKALRVAMPFIYVKSDGSVPGGFEIVTHPFSWDWVKKNEAAFDPVWGLVKKGYVSHDSGRCGMHVHMSKDAFSSHHLYKFIQFFQKNPEFILTASQRASKGEMERWAKVGYEGSSGRALMRMAKTKGGHGGRYQAVNLSPPKTVEIRIFRGTLKKERFFKNLELCQAIYDFTKQVNVKGCTVQNFLGFVSLNRHEYRNLHDFLKEKYKWQIVYRSKREPGQSRTFIRYEGRIAPAVEEGVPTDVPDEDWAEILKSKKEEETKRIHSKIARAAA